MRAFGFSRHFCICRWDMLLFFRGWWWSIIVLRRRRRMLEIVLA
jgi:hypothetical protein